MGGVALALLIALVGSCLLDLDHAIACGDGHVDELAGEECDPAVPSSYEGACAGTNRPDGQGACDPVACTIINDKEQCATCGDDTVDEEFGEECDGANLNGEPCPGGGDGLRCGPDCKFDYSDCDPCGNGVLEEGEECDPGAMGDLVIPRPCAGSEELEPLPSVDKPYSSGETVTCGDGCRYDRTQCNYCGDGVRDEPLPVDFNGVMSPAEWCDGDSIDEDRLFAEYGDNFCFGVAGERPNAGCGEDCRSFVDRTDIARCCRRRSEDCPTVGATIRCCYEYDHPDEAPCQEFFEGMIVQRLCK
jgi:hypothetical protein